MRRHYILTPLHHPLSLLHANRTIGFRLAALSACLVLLASGCGGKTAITTTATTEPHTPAYPQDRLPAVDAQHFGAATILDFTDGSRLPSAIMPYNFPTQQGGTYDPTFVNVDNNTNLLQLQAEVNPGRANEAKPDNPLSSFFTGTALVNPEFTYGERTVVARFPVERNANGEVIQQHKPVLILWPHDEAGDNWFHNVEVDFAEIFDAGRKSGDINVHYGATDHQVISDDFAMDDAFHAFTVRWTPQLVQIFVDNTLVSTIDDPEAIPKGAHRIVLQVDQAGLKNIPQDSHPKINAIEVQQIISRPYIG